MIHEIGISTLEMKKLRHREAKLLTDSQRSMADPQILLLPIFLPDDPVPPLRNDL